MKTTVTCHDFIDAFKIRTGQFSRPALVALFDYLGEIERESATEMELDVIAICCDFCEMTVQEIQNTYPTLCEDLDDNEKLTLDKALEILGNQTWVLGSTENNTVVFRQF